MIKKFNNFLNNIDKYLNTSTFDKLPMKYKKGVLIWMYEGDKVEWSIWDFTDWLNDDRINILINDYSKKYGTENWKYGMVPTNLIIAKIEEWIKLNDDYKSFNQYHRMYQQTNKANHYDSILPIIVSDNNEEYIEDGWHRFHYYINKGYKQIPVLKL